MNNYKPTPSERRGLEARVNQNTMLEVQVNHRIDTEWLDQYVNRIQFWSYTLTKVKPDTYASKFRVYTQLHIPEKQLAKQLQRLMPECRVYPCWGYKYRNTFDVRFNKPIRWDTFIWRCVTALAGYI